MSTSAISFSIKFENYNQHMFSVILELDQAHENQELTLPAWTPGSYLIRDFSQHIVSIKATQNKKNIRIAKKNKSCFVADNKYGNLKIEYQIYAFDNSIRSAYLDNQQAFFNGTAVFLRPHGFEESDYIIEICSNNYAQEQNWQVATGLSSQKICNQGFGTYTARNYDELVDCPVQIGELTKLKFEVLNISHELILVGDVREFDHERVKGDLKKLCSTHAKIFDNQLPFESYKFICRLAENSFGGLEHRNSSMLLSTPYGLPVKNQDSTSRPYGVFLSLCSHEYFHAWNIKKLKPKNFVKYDYDQENYTKLLWFFEGFTAYYDDLLVYRAGLISRENYLDILAKNITRVLNTPGRFVQNVNQASFDAWVKFYRPHENSPNLTISYYLVGSIIALLIDLEIRQNSQGEKSLDLVVRKLFQEFGNNQGVSEEQILSMIENIGGISSSYMQENYLNNYINFNLSQKLENFEMALEPKKEDKDSFKPNTFGIFMGFEFSINNNLDNKIGFVESGSPAMRAGLAPGDELIAVDNIRLEAKNKSAIFDGLLPKKPIKLVCARNNKLFNTVLVPEDPKIRSFALQINSESRLLESWLKSANYI